MAEAPVPKTKPNPAQDEAMHSRLRSAVARKIVTIYTDPARLNTVGSPVFDPWENTLALLSGFVMALFIMIGVSLIAGVIALVVAVVFYVALGRPYITEQVRRRTIDLILKSPKGLDIMWNYGGLAITRTDHPNIGAMAPEADWRVFIRRHLPDVSVAEHLGDEFKGPKPTIERRAYNRGGNRRSDDRG